MPRTCTVCSHVRRDEIERELVNRTSTYRDIARQYSVSKDAVSRHVASGHIAERLKKAKDEEDVRAALDVLGQLKAINTACFSVLKNARKSSEPEVVLKAVDRIQRQLELQAKLLGDLDE